jgi:4-carboxymuconolactone decarboxylase
MSSLNQHLAGRLSLLDPKTLTPARQKLYDRLIATMVAWSEGAAFQSRTDQGELIGPFNPILYSPDITTSFMDFHDADEKHSILTERVRQVAILAVGAVWKSEYELYAHKAAARIAGISEADIHAVVDSEFSNALPEDEKCAQRYAYQLSTAHRVDDDVYKAAETAFGQQGVVELTFVIGFYHVVCSLLNAFNIPAPEAAS